MRASRRAWIPIAVMMLAACAFDDNPSLGRFESELGGEVPAPPVMDAGTTPDADVDAARAGDAGGRDRRDPRVGDGGPVDAGAACFAGRYEAELDCTLEDARLFPFDPNRPPPSGPTGTTAYSRIQFTLETSLDGRDAHLVESDFTFSAWGLVFMGRLDGRLDCATGHLDARIVDGLAGQPFSPTTIPFVGELSGDVVDPFAGTFAGTWWHGPADGMMGCRGDWTAHPVP